MNDFQARKIKELRKKKGLSQRELGRHLGISDRAVSKWENGLSQPSGRNLILLSRIFDVPVESFLSDALPRQDKTSDGMESLKELYKAGRGPSSSHTIGPEKACQIFKSRHKDADAFKAILYGSLARTGKGHGTDVVIKKTFSPYDCTVEFNVIQTDLEHPNTMELIAYKNFTEAEKIKVFSVGGGSVVFQDEICTTPPRIYKLNTFASISEYCKHNSMSLWEYALSCEDDDFMEYMRGIWQAMKDSIKSGLQDEGILPGGLNVIKKAKSLYESEHIDESAQTRENRLVCAYAFAIGEQNASGEKIVTAPTCGAAGVLPAVMYYEQQRNDFSDDKIVKALITAGIIGNIIKTNASISGAQCGCQAEVGSACAMASAALAQLFGLGIEKIEYAAEIAIEHHLGLTCDPIAGLVQIPCIERNAVAAMRAINAVNLSNFLWNTRRISFDKVVKTMKETGLDMCSSYKETSQAGLAKLNLE